MILYQLCSVLGDNINAINGLTTETNAEERKLAIAKADALTRIARQALKAYSTLMDADKLVTAERVSRKTAGTLLGDGNG